VPAVAKLHDRVEVPEPVTVIGPSAHGALPAERLTTPVNPFRAPTVIVEVPATPVFTDIVVGFAPMEKSAAAGPTTTVRVALVFTRAPDVALMVA